jgi:cyclomaltodextrinase / maltogenic alpha-amylase / neopullulanase
VTGWIDDAIWWQVYPLGFTGAEKTAVGTGPQHRLEKIVDWLDYLVELGCNGLLLGPIFASETHGYDTIDHFAIDPRLGDEGDFAALADAASARGVRIALDGVFNHVAGSFPHPEWFRRDPSGELATFEGHRHLIELNHDDPRVAAYVIDVMRYWLERGASGWRLDAAYAVNPAFWAKVLPVVRQACPDAWFLGEMIHGHYAGYAREAGLNSVTQYELWKAIWSSLNDQNFFELAWALDRHDAFAEGTLPQTFVGNHDVTRLASRLTDSRHIGHALAILFTTGGVPSVYYGDEQAFRGVKEDRENGDDEIRPAFPAGPSGLAPDGWPVYRLHQRLIGFRRRHRWLVHARSSVQHLSNETVAIRSSSGDNTVITLLNIGDKPYRFAIDPGGLTVAEAADPGAEPLLVPPHSWTIIALPYAVWTDRLTTSSLASTSRPALSYCAPGAWPSGCTGGIRTARMGRTSTICFG